MFRDTTKLSRTRQTQSVNPNWDQLYPIHWATWNQWWAWTEPDHGLVIHRVWSSAPEVRTHTYTSCFKSIHRVSPGSARGDLPILSCYILQPQQRTHWDWMPPSLYQKPVVSPTILVFQKYGLPGRCGAAGRAGRAEWHSWFPVLWADYCWLFPTACSCSGIYFTEALKLFFHAWCKSVWKPYHKHTLKLLLIQLDKWCGWLLKKIFPVVDEII